MIHQPMGGMQGQAKDMEIAALHIQKLKERLYSILSENTHQNIETLRQDCDRDCYMDAGEALAYGLIDTII
ncbi:ClpP family protease, partial [Streptococcus gordonii]